MADQNKTEKATPRRRLKAREQGQVARSRDLTSGLLSCFRRATSCGPMSVWVSVAVTPGTGDIMIAPYDADKACRYCDMNPVCPRPRAAYVERKAGDARIAVIDEQIRSVE